MRQILTVAIILLAFSTLQAQQVQKCCNTISSSFLLGSMDYARHNQGIYLPSDFQNAPAGNITRLYFRYGTTNISLGNTVTDLTISLLQSQQTSHINNQFITGLTSVMTSAEFTIPPGVTDQWFHIDLDQPFPYDPSLSLIVDILFDQSERLMTFRAVGTPGRKLNSGDPLSPVSTTGSNNLHDIGFDLDSPTGIPTEGPMVTMLYPNPATDVLHVRFDHVAEGPGHATVSDALGRMVLQRPVAAGTDRTSFDVSTLAPGMYVIGLSGDSGASMARQFIRE